MKCKCGCGKDIIEKSWHKYYRHDFLKGHRPSLKKRKVFCDYCKKIFEKIFTSCNEGLKHNFCSRKCTGRYKALINCFICTNCGKSFYRHNGKQALSRSKYKKLFCSIKCCGEYYSRERHPKWRGGLQRTKDGYFEIKNENVRLKYHRYIMEQSINRKLNKNEIVHHINGDRKDNRVENLCIMTNSEHTKLHWRFKKNGLVSDPRDY